MFKAGGEFAFMENDVATSLIEVNGEPKVTTKCYAPVTIPSLNAKGLHQYAWLPWSKIPASTRKNAPHGAYVYENKPGATATKQYKAVGEG